MITAAGLDWFVPALQGGSAAAFDRVICIEESKLQFARCLKTALGFGVLSGTDSVAQLHADVKVLEQTLQLRLGVLALDRPQAWFRHSPATERGPFAATVYEEPVFSRFEEGRAISIRHLLPEMWRLQQISDSAYDPSHSLWGRLLQLNKRYAQLRQLPHPFADVAMDELPEALPDVVSSPALVQYAGQLCQRLRACRKDLDACFQMLWARSESFLYALHIQHLSAKARQQQEAPRRPHMPEAAVDALRFMNFGTLPSFADLKQRYRTMAHSMHPDKGGSEDRFHLLTQHYQQILRLLQRV